MSVCVWGCVWHVPPGPRHPYTVYSCCLERKAKPKWPREWVTKWYVFYVNLKSQHCKNSDRRVILLDIRETISTYFRFSLKWAQVIFERKVKVALRTLWGSWAQRLAVSHFLIIEKYALFSLQGLCLSFNEQIQTITIRKEKGILRQGRGSQETVKSWGRVWSSSQRIHITISLSSFAEAETPTKWEKLTVARRQVGPRPMGTGLMILIPDYLTTNQSKECPLVD